MFLLSIILNFLDRNARAPCAHPENYCSRESDRVFVHRFGTSVCFLIYSFSYQLHFHLAEVHILRCAKEGKKSTSQIFPRCFFFLFLCLASIFIREGNCPSSLSLSLSLSSSPAAYLRGSSFCCVHSRKKRKVFRILRIYIFQRVTTNFRISGKGPRR